MVYSLEIFMVFACVISILTILEIIQICKVKAWRKKLKIKDKCYFFNIYNSKTFVEIKAINLVQKAAWVGNGEIRDVRVPIKRLYV